MTAASELTAAGFTAANDGALRIPAAPGELNPVGNMFFEVRITGGNGTSITVVVHKSAIKVANTTRETAGASSASLIDDR